jgi:hypothetical protein
MTWAMIAQLIVQVGWPMAQTIIAKIESGAAVTGADLAELLGMAKQSATDRMSAQLTAAGIALTDPHAVALLALVK